MSARSSTIASWGLGLALTSAAAAGPALAEAKVHRQLRERLGVDEQFAVDLDLGGLELRGLSRTLPHNRGRVSADRIRIRPGERGLIIEIEGLDGLILQRTETKAPGAPAPESAPKSDGEPGPDRVAQLLQKLRGVPIQVVSHGQIAVELSDGVRATARDPGVELPGDGRLVGRLAVDFGTVADSDWARAELEFAAIDERPRDLQVSGQVELDGAVTQLEFDGRVSDTRSRVHLRESAGGHATLTLDRNFEAGRDRLAILAEALPLALLEPLARLSGQRLADALGERDGQLRLAGARVSGGIELVRGAGLTRARFDGLELAQLTIDSSLLAPDPVSFDRIHIDGSLTREHTAAGTRSAAQLTVDHAGVALAVSGQIDDAGVVFDVELPSTPCQTVLAALPGSPEVLVGTRLRGQLEAHFGFSLDFAEVAAARQRYLGVDAEPLELDEFEAPGQLRVSLPYLEQCAVERLGPNLDIGGLDGPYHHRFVSGSGAEQHRVLALGDVDYVAMKSVPRVAQAFVILEDARFWDHDGFDREAIERAFWLNVLEGRVSRGASTISQQTARSLWLGIDRSVARKLAEALLTVELERGLDKRRILELYLNIIELGPEVHGVAEASRYHFGREAHELTLIEALHLASMAPAPVTYARRFADGHIDAQWRDHLRAQIRRLRIRHLISAEQAREASKLRLRLRQHPELIAGD